MSEKKEAEKTMVDPTSLILHEKQLFQLDEQPFFTSYRPVDVIPKGSPTFQWKGPKIQHKDWIQALAFMAWVNKHNRDEAQLRFFAMPDKIAVWAFPQEKGGGMTTKEVQNEDQEKQTAHFLQQGGFPWGTIHSHCNSSAFQSGTDRHDEENQDGLHITIGKLDQKDFYDIDFRFYYYGLKYNVTLESFIDPGRKVTKSMLDFAQTFNIPREQVVKKLLTRALSDEQIEAEGAFPEQWKENLIEPVRTVTHYPHAYQGGRYYQGNGRFSGSYSRIIKGVSVPGEITSALANHIRAQQATNDYSWVGAFTRCSYTKRTNGLMTVAEILSLLKIASFVDKDFSPKMMQKATISTKKDKDSTVAERTMIEAFKETAVHWGHTDQTILVVAELLSEAHALVEEEVIKQDEKILNQGGFPDWEGSHGFGCMAMMD